MVGRGSAWIARARVRLQHPVVAVGLGLVLLQAVYRGWAAAGGWFYADDFELLEDAHRSGLTWSYLIQPHDSQFMPGGRLAAWLVSEFGPFAWWPAATQTVILQLTASLAALIMLLTLVGVRWVALAPLAFYLFTPLTISGFMWWASALNQLPMHATLFLAVTMLIIWLRRRHWPWLAGLALVIATGLLFYVKTVLVIGVLAMMVVLLPPGAGRTSGKRLMELRERLPALIPLGALTVAYLAYYSTSVPSPLISEGTVDYGALFRTMFVTALPVSLVGGPWSWDNDNPPVGTLGTSTWVGASILLVFAAIATAWLVRERARRRALSGILIAMTYLLVNYLLVARGRAVVFGEVAGLELRYLTDAAAVLCLAVGLTLTSTSSPGPAQPNGATSDQPAVWRRRNLIGAATVVALSASSLISTTRYIGLWHDDYPARSFVSNVAQQARLHQMTVADLAVPPPVAPTFAFPRNLPSRLFFALPNFRATDAGNDLRVLDESGTARDGAVVASATSTPGPAPGCGYRVDSGNTQTIELDGEAPALWWVEIRYLADRDGEVELTLSGRTDTYRVLRGPHRLFVQGEGDPGRVSLRTEGSTIMCVDQVLIGDLQPWEPL